MIDNEFYKTLGERWWTSEEDAVALLRYENATKTPWVRERARGRVLDVGCGGGFLTVELAKAGFAITGLDVEESVLAPGRVRRPDVDWIVGRAEALPFGDGSFDTVCMMDVLEHLEEPRAAVREALRVLRPGGQFLFHTFNRTPLAWLLAAKGLDWFIGESPQHVHDWRLFIKPRELRAWIEAEGWEVTELSGIHPRFKSVLKLLFTRRVPRDFQFAIGGPLQVGYLGCATRALS